MPLIGGRINAYRDLAGLEFGMKDGNKLVRVHVSSEALDDIQPPTDGTRNYPHIFDRNRTKIESIASRKYDAGHLEKDGLIHVRRSDLN